MMMQIELELKKIPLYVDDPTLQAAIEYALFPGKRLRAKLLLNCIEQQNGQICTQAIAAAAAIETTHAFSLIHDDMPELDNAALRRGQPSFFKKYGQANALLVGDLMQYLAQYHLRHAPALATILVEAAKDMVLGQILETNHGASNLSELQKIQDLKTARLFEACGAMAASLLELAPEPTLELRQYCRNYGRVLQWQDDINDIHEDATGTNILHFISKAELLAKIKETGIILPA